LAAGKKYCNNRLVWALNYFRKSNGGRFMSDSTTNGNDKKKRFEKMAQSPLVTFSKPYLELIGKGRLFSIIYIVMAIINPIIPFVILYKVIDSGFFSLGAKFVFAFILAWLVIVFACWIGFQLWWDRRKRAAYIETTDFFATMNFSGLLQTFGEWLGTLIAIIGAGGGLLASFFLGNDVDYLFSMIGLEFMQFGVFIVIIGPITGLLIIITFRFFAEQLRLWAALVNNTKEIAENIKSKA
jgi:hypothetical protein